MLIGTRGDLRTAWRRSPAVERRAREPATEARVSHDLLVAVVAYEPGTLGRAARVCRAWWQALADLPRPAELVYDGRFRSPTLDALRAQRCPDRWLHGYPELGNIFRDIRVARCQQVVPLKVACNMAYAVPNAWRAGQAVRPLKRTVVRRLVLDVLLGREPTVPPVPRF